MPSVIYLLQDNDHWLFVDRVAKQMSKALLQLSDDSRLVSMTWASTTNCQTVFKRAIWHATLIWFGCTGGQVCLVKLSLV